MTNAMTPARANAAGSTALPNTGAPAALRMPVPSVAVPERTLRPAQWGMLAFLVSEAAFFATLLVTYIALVGSDHTGPTPAQALHLPLVIATTCLLLASSGTVHMAEQSFHRGRLTAFCGWWAATIALGLAFLAGTAYEWVDLITHEHLTPWRNLFGSGFFTVVGFHALHVSAGVLTMLIILGLAMQRRVTARHGVAVQLVSWYWHFVDAVWVVVFTVVYCVMR